MGSWQDQFSERDRYGEQGPIVLSKHNVTQEVLAILIYSLILVLS